MKNNIIYSILIVLLIYQATAAGQSTGSLQLDQLTLDDAVNWSLNNSPSLIMKRLKLQKDEQELSRIRRSKAPDIYLSGDFRRNLIIPTTPIPASIMDPAADPGEMLYMKFNTGWNSAAGINLSLDIFNPAASRQTSEQKMQNRISNYDLQISENDLQAEVAKAYAACVISQDQLESFRDDTVFYSKSLADAELLYKKNQISLTDRNNIVIACNTSLMQYHNAENVLSEAKANLLYLLGEEVSPGNLASLHLSENIPALYRKMSPETNEFINSSHVTGKGSDLSRQSEIIALAQSRVKSSQLKSAPSLSLKGFYGSNYYSNDFNPGNIDYWHGNSYLAASLKIPLAQAFTLKKETSQFRLQENIERENLRDMQNRKSKDLIEAADKLAVSVKEYEITGKNYELSVQNLDASRAQLYKEYLQEKDLLEEQVRCRNTYQKFLEAAYNVFINTIELQKLESE